MHVLMIAPQPFFQPRGTPFSVLHRLRALGKLGHEIDLVTYPIGQNVDIEGVEIIRAPSVPGIRKVKIGPSLVKIPLDVVLFFKALRMLKSRSYDLLHTHEEAGFFGTYLADRFRLPHLYDMHSSLPQQLLNFKYPCPRFVVRLFEKLESMTIRRADAVITICPELYNYVAEKFPGTDQVLIENVADNADVFPRGEGKKEEDLKGKYGINGSSTILYAGTFEPYQGLDLLIDAGRHTLERQKDVVFLLVGGSPKQVERYRHRVEEMGLGRNFIFTGSVAPEDIERFIKIADVLVSPRVDGTNTPLKIYSYLRSGKPIVATRHITHTQVLNEDVAVLAECEAADFARGILQVLEHPERAVELAGRAKALADREYSYSAYLEKTKEIYDLLEKKLRNHGRSS